MAFAYSYSTVSLASLIIQETKEAIYKTALAVADLVGLPVSAWQAGDPTRSLFHLESEMLSKLEEIVVGYIRAGFLDYAAQAAIDGGGTPAARAWLNVLAKQMFNVDVPAATNASCTVVLSNSGGGLYADIQAGDITLKSTFSGKTYRNTSGGTLASGPGTTLTIDVEAEEAGSESSAAAGEIDELVTGLLGVSCSNPSAAVGIDEQDPATTVQQCRDKLGSLSPNGPKEAYSYVARNPALTGTTAVTRVRAFSDSDIGEITLYLASPSGGSLEVDRALVELAILKWATPLCITPTVLSATTVAVPVTYELWIYKSCNKSAAEVEAAVFAALSTMFANRPIGGDIITGATSGKLYKTMIESTIRGVFPQGFRVRVSTPTVDSDIANNEVAALGTVLPTIYLTVDP